MELFKLTLNQPEIKEQGITLISHHNKAIVRAKSEVAARKLVKRAVQRYASFNPKMKRLKDEGITLTAPWTDPSLALCKVFKGDQYPLDGKAAILFPPDLES